jgi:hypothetical protein
MSVARAVIRHARQSDAEAIEALGRTLLEVAASTIARAA